MTIELYISDMNNMFWYCNNMNHNKYDPAIISATGYKKWYINDVEYPYVEYIVEVEQLNTNK